MPALAALIRNRKKGMAPSRSQASSRPMASLGQASITSRPKQPKKSRRMLIVAVNHHQTHPRSHSSVTTYQARGRFVLVADGSSQGSSLFSHTRP